jgi:hypothetical protein
MTGLSILTDSWKSFSGTEKRNITIYILGIMLYKFGLEAFNGSIIGMKHPPSTAGSTRRGKAIWRRSTAS